jgi:hypothetical protein
MNLGLALLIYLAGAVSGLAAFFFYVWLVVRGDPG